MNRKLISLALFLTAFASAAFAQVRPVEQPKEENTVKKVAPVSFEAKYEGGMFGFSKKEEGTLRFDDDGLRLVFFGKDNKEKFHIPYKAILVIYPSERKVQSGTGKTVGAIPFPGAGIGGSFMKKKKHYMAVQFNDPDVEAQGTTNFLIDTGDLLESVIQTLGEKAKLTQRGDAYYRPRSQTDSDIEEF
jgi:hypothetical protein